MDGEHGLQFDYSRKALGGGRAMPLFMRLGLQAADARSGAGGGRAMMARYREQSPS